MYFGNSDGISGSVTLDGPTGKLENWRGILVHGRDSKNIPIGAIEIDPFLLNDSNATQSTTGAVPKLDFGSDMSLSNEYVEEGEILDPPKKRDQACPKVNSFQVIKEQLYAPPFTDCNLIGENNFLLPSEYLSKFCSQLP